MSPRKMKRLRAWRSYGCLALTGAAWMACTLNPQPIPPGDTLEDGGFTSGGGCKKPPCPGTRKDGAVEGSGGDSSAGDAGDAGDGGDA
ncbi:hypothetical protein [Pendulispora albinea]|uniref:Secreted protein n=1 Tax=Pendulispora albinea TaxID=2741071 RepID=A0ABZ2LXW6_9BACT